MAPLRGSIGEGNSAAVSPRGDRVAFLYKGQVWAAALDGKLPPSPAFQARGESARLRWSPEGARLAFESRRGDHSFIGVYDFATGTLRYLDPGTDFDSMAEWSPDGHNVAFLRIPSTGLRQVREAQRTGEPWSIRVASVETGAGREIWRAPEGRGSVYPRNHRPQPDPVGRGRPYRLPLGAGRLDASLLGSGRAAAPAALLTPGAFEVEQVALTPDRRDRIFNSNQDDIDRRHLWRVAVTGGAPTADHFRPGDRMGAGASARRLDGVPALRRAASAASGDSQRRRRSATSSPAPDAADFPCRTW